MIINVCYANALRTTTVNRVKYPHPPKQEKKKEKKKILKKKKKKKWRNEQIAYFSKYYLPCVHLVIEMESKNNDFQNLECIWEGLKSYL